MERQRGWQASAEERSDGGEGFPSPALEFEEGIEANPNAARGRKVPRSGTTERVAGFGGGAKATGEKDSHHPLGKMVYSIIGKIKWMNYLPEKQTG